MLDLASPASPVDFATMPLEILAVGSTGTRNLLDLAVAQGARFFLASTSEVYGDPLVHPQPESYLGNVSCIGPRSCYDEAKRFSEALTMAYHRWHGLDVRIVRIFNTYGERMRPDDGRVVNTFVVQALRGEPITLHGDGTPDAQLLPRERRGARPDRRARRSDHRPGQRRQPGRVHDARARRGRDRADRFLERDRHRAAARRREGDPLQRQPDITLVSTTHGWQPSVDLRDGLARMIEHFRHHEQI
ncbi:MAG: NAD-dependent epimerase/dehydratase family protein [Microthrixaceae bacterium]